MDNFEMSYETIWQVYYKEKQTNELQLLPDFFYSDTQINSIKTDLKDEENQKEFSIKENINLLITKIFEKRKQKILIYSAYNKSLPQPIPNIELNFYNKLQELKNTYILNIKQTQVNISLKSLDYLPEIILPSGEKIGPLKKEEIIEIKSKESEDINFLINNSICVKL